MRDTDPAQSTMDAYHAIVMDTFDTVCNVKVRLGGKYLSGCHVMDGQKYVCLDELIRDISNQECVVYSFGIKDDWSFEDSIAGFGCKVYAFDPTIDNPESRSTNIVFKKIGVVGKQGIDNDYHTLDQILEDNSHTETNISYLKLDIEAHELSGIPLWLKSGALNNVQQIAAEIHLSPHEENATLNFFESFKDLELQGNFRIFNWEANNCFKNYNKDWDYFGFAEIVLKKINTSSSCSR